LAISKPIVVICMWTAPSRDSSQRSPYGDSSPGAGAVHHTISGCELPQQTTPLIDQFVCEQLDRIGHIEAKRLGHLQIDDKLKLGRLQDREVGRLRTLQDLSGVGADLTKSIDDVRSVAHQPAGFNNLATPISCRNPVA